MASMKRLILYCFIFSAAWGAGAQELQFSQPVKLGQEVNSDDEELAPMLSPDGQTLYFTRAFHSKNTGGKYAGTDIWISRKDANGNWTPAVNAGKPWNNKRSNAVIGISADGSTVYLSNAYNNRSGISFSKLVAGKWTKPEFIPVPGINRDDFVSVYVHPSTDVMVISMKGKGSYGEEDLYVSLKDSLGNWNQPRNLGPSINTSGFEISPFLTLDKRRLYFSSIGHPGFGNADIFYSDRLYDSWDTWTVPKNLGEVVNSTELDGYFSLSSDSIAYFASNKSESKADVNKLKISQLGNEYQRQEILKVVQESKQLLSELQKGNSKDLPLPSVIIFDKQGELDEESKLILDNFIQYLKRNPTSILSLRFKSLLKPTDQVRVTSLKRRIAEFDINESRLEFFVSSDPVELSDNNAELSIKK